MTCPNCGTPIVDPHQSVCPKCGLPLTPQTDSNPTTQSTGQQNTEQKPTTTQQPYSAPQPSQAGSPDQAQPTANQEQPQGDQSSPVSSSQHPQAANPISENEANPQLGVPKQPAAQQGAPQQGAPQGMPQQNMPPQGMPQQNMPPQGIPLQGGFQVQSTQPKTKKPLTSQQKMLIIGGIVLVAVIIILVIVFSVVNSQFSADKVVDKYVNAIATGNYEDANKMADPHAESYQKELVSNKAATAQKNKMLGLHVEQQEKLSDGSIQFDYAYTMDNKEQHDTVVAAPSGSRMLFFKNWEIRSSSLIKEIKFSTPQTFSSLNINGITIQPDVKPTPGSFTFTNFNVKVYPGTYKVSLPKSKYYSSNTISITTDILGGSSSDSLNVTPTDDLKKAIQDQVNKKLDACAATNEAKPKGCPIESYMAEDPGRARNVKWKIDTYPSVKRIDPNDGSFFADSGQATASYEYKLLDEWKPDTDTDHIYFNGTYKIDGDKVTIEYKD